MVYVVIPARSGSKGLLDKNIREIAGRPLLAYSIEFAKNSGIKTIRLDVYEKNIPAIKLYEKNGFIYTGTVDLGLGNYGLKWFRLYEKII